MIIAEDLNLCEFAGDDHSSFFHVNNSKKWSDKKLVWRNHPQKSMNSTRLKREFIDTVDNLSNKTCSRKRYPQNFFRLK